MSIPNSGGGSARPAQEWTIPQSKKRVRPAVAPPLAPEPETAPTKESPTGNGDGGGGNGQGQGAYVPASQVSHQPRWIANFITEGDYPSVARQQGKDGRVIVTLLIDQEGHVRDTQLVQGSYEVLNEVAMRKLKEAVFSPAYDAAGRPVACKVTVPIRFELK